MRRQPAPPFIPRPIPAVLMIRPLPIPLRIHDVRVNAGDSVHFLRMFM